MLQSLLLVLFAAGIGVVLLLWGYRAFLVLLPVFGFFAGFWFGAEVTSLILGKGFLADVTGFVAGVAVGLVVAVLAYIFYAIAVGIVAAMLGYGLGSGLMQAHSPDAAWMTVLAGVVFAVAVLILVFWLNLQKYTVIALTAIAGANSLVLAVLLLLGRVTAGDEQGAGNSIQPVLQDGWFWSLVWLAIAAAGVVYQIRTDGEYAFDSEEYVTGWS